jgi:RecA-family ATPase
VKEDEHIRWLVEDFLPDVGWTFFIGAEGSGKTTFALQLCDSLEKGIPFLGMKTVKAKTLYIQADSASKEWRAMLQLVLPNKGEQSKDFTIVNVPSGCLSNATYVAQLDTYINEHIQPDFIVWDSLYELAGVSINGEKALEPIFTMKLLSGEKGWLLLHHPPNEEMRAAGSRSISANASGVWFLTKNKLLIQKRRLSGKKELLISRQQDTRGGLWAAKTVESELEKKYPLMG